MYRFDKYRYLHHDGHGPGHDHEHDHAHDAQTHTHTHTHDGSTHTHTHSHDEEGHTHADGSHAHKHVHSVEEKRAVLNRLSRAIGHLEKVKRMVEKDEDCSDVLIQLAAVRSAINNTGKVILSNHITHCVREAIEEGDTDTLENLNKAIEMFVR